MHMLFDPAEWLSNFMDLTYLSLGFKLIILSLAAAGFFVAYVSERRVFPIVAKYVGRLKSTLRPHYHKKRKKYKEILDEMEE